MTVTPAPLPAAFLSLLQVEQISDTVPDGRGTWRLLGPLVFRSAVFGQVITVPAGFITDFASVPRWVPGAAWLIDRAHAAAVVHDYLYTVHISTQEQADRVLREAALTPIFGASDAVPAWVAWCLYNGVRLGGASHWTEPGAPQPAHVAAQLDAAQYGQG